ncbi:MAG: RNA methyltransferase [Clostridiales bacterium]|nr:RNA methyltransferase [Clostridiales bacterium]
MTDFIKETITSRQNPLVTRVSKLSDKKYRDAERLFRIDGVKLFSEAVKSQLDVEYVFIAESSCERICNELSGELSKVSGRIIKVTDEVLSKLTDEKAPQGIVTVARQFEVGADNISIGADHRALLLSSIRDPGNLGTIIRTAYALGIDCVYMSSDCADIYSPKTIRAAMGSIFRQRLSIVADELEFAAKLRNAGCEIYAAALRDNAVRLGNMTLPDKVCFAVGNEGHGLSNEFIEACSGTVIIPMNPECESLNAASAAGIICWEICRERLLRR